ncbi:MAG: tetratricopeptide repeat protein, partial [Aggregatilineales bacterium]
SLALYAYFCLLLGDLDAARRAAQESRALRAEHPDPEAEGIACCALGRLALRAGDLTDAIAAFEAALKALNALREDQARAHLLHLLGDLHAQHGDLERAIASYRRALGFATSESLLTQLALAEALEAAGRLPEALEAGGEAITTLHPQRMTADLTILGFAYARQARRQARAGRAERAQVLADQWLHSLAARLDEALAQPDPALNALAIGLSLRADFESAFAERDPIELIDLAERAVQVAEERAAGSLAVWAARRDLAELYRRLGRDGEALEVLAPLLAAQDARSETGESLTWRDIFLCAARACPPSEQKFSYYRAAREREPDRYARGLLSLEEARLYRRASEARAASARLDEASLDAFFAWLDLNDLQRGTLAAYEGAVFDFKRAGDEKRLAEALLEAGEFCTRIGQHGKAIKALRGALRVFGRGVRLDPARLAQLYADLGTAQANVGRAAQAAESFRQALRLIDQFSAPERYAAILTAFARAELRLRAYQSAATAYQEVLQFDQPPAERQQLLAELGKALRKLNQHEAAARAYAAALSIPEGDSARRAALERALAECYLALADYDSAQRHYERALA